MAAPIARTIALAILILSWPAFALGGDVHQAAAEAQARQKLDQVRAEIRKISDIQRQTGARKGEALSALREQELKVAAAAKDLRALDQKLAGQQGELENLQTQRDALAAKLRTQRDALAALLRSAYAMGQNEELKLLLAQDNAATIGRLLAYYRYFERARIGEIGTLLTDLDALAQVQQAIERQLQALQSTRDERSAEAQRLSAERALRVQALKTLDATLKDQQSRLAALGKDEQGLVELLEKLRDVFADIPQQIAGAEPFAQLRGRLPWPLRVTTHIAPGASDSDRPGQGIIIAATPGTEVHAVSHGRVAFADWLRGFGLLLIVDHGDGYLSLYGYNEALLKDVGDWVDANEVIATSGASGGRKTPGLYFELRYQGKPIDPRGWLTSSAHQ